VVSAARRGARARQHVEADDAAVAAREEDQREQVVTIERHDPDTSADRHVQQRGVDRELAGDRLGAQLLASSTRELPARRRAPPDDRGDLVERLLEHVVQHEGRAIEAQPPGDDHEPAFGVAHVEEHAERDVEHASSVLGPQRLEPRSVGDPGVGGRGHQRVRAKRATAKEQVTTKMPASHTRLSTTQCAVV
jgi:hypothetical protein